jgi:hypothetical protein
MGASPARRKQARNFLRQAGSALRGGGIPPSLSGVTPRLLRVLLLLLLGFGGSLHAAEATAPATLAELQERLERRLRSDRFRGGLWGVQVVSLASGRVWFEHEPRPAMNRSPDSVPSGLGATEASTGVRMR